MSINGVPPGANGPNRRKRCRIKGLIKKTIEQIEFYFSEPNLRRDLNFRKLAGSNGTKPVPIVQFLKFNKVAELTQDIQVRLKLQLLTFCRSFEFKYHFFASDPKKNSISS